MLLVAVYLAFSRYGRIKLGRDDDQPEFSTVSWLTMLFAAGMGVGLLYWGAAEPISHYLVIRDYQIQQEAATSALFVTNFHWGLHAWAIYAVTALVIAYFGFRKGCSTLLSAPIQHVFGRSPWTRGVGWLSDLLAIYAIAIAVWPGEDRARYGLGHLCAPRHQLYPALDGGFEPGDGPTIQHCHGNRRGAGRVRASHRPDWVSDERHN